MILMHIIHYIYYYIVFKYFLPALHGLPLPSPAGHMYWEAALCSLHSDSLYKHELFMNKQKFSLEQDQDKKYVKFIQCITKLSQNFIKIGHSLRCSVAIVVSEADRCLKLL